MAYTSIQKFAFAVKTPNWHANLNNSVFNLELLHRPAITENEHPWNRIKNLTMPWYESK